MRTPLKVAVGCASLFAVALVMGAISVGVFYLVSAAIGENLATEGYLACLNQNYDLAEVKLRAALRTEMPREQKAYAHLNLGAAYNAHSNFDAAITELTAAIQLDNKIANAYSNRGFSYARKHETDKALSDLAKAIALDPNSFDAFLNRGLIFFDQSNWDKALADFQEAARCDPANSQVLVDVGLCYWRKHDFDRALASFDGAVAVQPTNPTAYQNRGALYRALGQKDKSARDLLEAARLSPAVDLSTSTSTNARPSFPFNSSARGRLLPIAPGLTFDTAIAGRSPVGPTAQDLADSARLAFRAGNYDRAIEFCNDAMTKQNKPNAAAAIVMMRAGAYFKKGDFDHALRDYGEAAALNPNQIQAYIGRAAVYAHKDDFVNANRELDTISAGNVWPVSAALNSVAWVRATWPKAQLRDGKRAVEGAKKACELTNWADWRYIDTLAAAFAESGDFSQAANYQMWVLQQIPLQDEHREEARKRLELYRQHKPYRQPEPER